MIAKIKEKFTSAVNMENGFTLIELMIVIAIIGILAAVAIPKLTGVKGRANISAVQSELKSLQSSLEMYYIDHGSYPTGGLSNLVPSYTSQEAIEDPGGNEYGTGGGSTANINDDDYEIEHEVPGTDPTATVILDSDSGTTVSN